jgi:hypothetical protein
MTELNELLQVDEAHLPANTLAAVRYMDRRWGEMGRPQRKDAIIRLLDGGLRFCKEQGMRYPKIYLRRLKELQRGDWLLGMIEPTTAAEPMRAPPGQMVRGGWNLVSRPI